MCLILKIVAAAVFIKLVHGIKGIPGRAYTKCSKYDDDLDECLVKLVDDIRPYLISGVPKIGFPQLEPFLMESVPIDVSVPGLTLKGVATNVATTGSSNFRIDNFKINYDDSTAEFTLLIPKLEVKADFVVNGTKVLFFSVEATGKFEGTFENLLSTIKVRGRLDDETEFGGEVFLRIPYTNIKVTFGSTHYKITPKHSTLKTIVASNLINYSPKSPVLFMLKSRINTIAAQLVKKYVNSVLENIPLKDILKD